MIQNLKSWLIAALVFLLVPPARAQNSFITSQFTADPTARVFGDRVYVYPSHDIPCEPGKGHVG